MPSSQRDTAPAHARACTRCLHGPSSVEAPVNAKRAKELRRMALVVWAAKQPGDGASAYSSPYTYLNRSGQLKLKPVILTKGLRLLYHYFKQIDGRLRAS